MSRLLLIGPKMRMTSNGGTRHSFEQLSSYLKNRLPPKAISVIYTTEYSLSILSFLHVLISYITSAGTSDKALINITPGRGLFLTLPLAIISKVFGISFYTRLFGDDIRYVINRSYFHRFSFAIITYLSNQTFVQTKNTQRVLSNKYPRISHLPTSRPIKNNVYIPLRILPSEPIQLLYVGRIGLEKGIMTVIELSEYHHPGINIRVAGPLALGYEDEKRFLGSHIDYLGEISSDDVINEMSSSHFLVFPSCHIGEGYPGTIIESFQCSLPVIANNWNCLSELVRDGYNGFCVPKLNASRLLHLALLMQSDQERYYRMRINAFNSGIEFDSHVVYDRLSVALGI